MEKEKKKIFISPKEASEIYSVSIWTLYKMAEKKELRSYRLGKLLRFKPEDVEQAFTQKG